MSAVIKRTNSSSSTIVVEDEALIQPLLVDPLEEAGFQVLIASSGGEAIKLLEGQETGSIRALVTDIKLGPSSPSRLGGCQAGPRSPSGHPCRICHRR
jgi:CheY-like chemotaxis protein